MLTVKGLEGGEHPGSLGGSGVITLVLRRGRGGSEGDVTAEQRSKSRGPSKPSYAGSLSSWAGRRHAFSWEPPEGKRSPADAFEIPDLQSCRRCLCWVRWPSLWWFGTTATGNGYSVHTGWSQGGTGSWSEPGFDSLPFITHQWVRPFLDSPLGPRTPLPSCK